MRLFSLGCVFVFFCAISDSFVFPPLVTRHADKPLLSITDFYKKLETHGIQKIIADDTMEDLTGIGTDGDIVGHTMIKNPIMLAQVLEMSLKNHVDLELTPVSLLSSPALWKGIFQSLLYIPLVMIAWSFISATGKLPMSIMNRGEQTLTLQTISNITLNDWAGSPEVLRECAEVASFLTEGDRYAEIGAIIPRGILLEGPPGTGKTLLARAMAGVTNSSFIITAGSEFVQMFVGLGALRIRQLFSQARENRPCIIFIDEIDAIGRKRSMNVGMGSGGGNDEREQTLNQLLVEMDGFQDNTDIIVIAATNRKDMLDDALLRPGRFDRIIHIPLPDRESRLQILSTHANGRLISSSIGTQEWEKIAFMTEGFSGADLQNILNEAAILSVRDGMKEITLDTIRRSIEKKLVGVAKETDMRGEAIRKRVAIHEAGHAIVCLEFPEYFSLQKVTIQATYQGAGGYTMYQPHSDMLELETRDYLKKRLCILMGGKAAESMMYGEDHVSGGASADLQQANMICREMITVYGMGGKELENTVLSSSFPDSEAKTSIIDREIQTFMAEAYRETRQILEKRRDLLEQMTTALLVETTIHYDDNT